MHSVVAAAAASRTEMARWKLALLCAGYLLLAFPLVLLAYRGLPLTQGASFMIATGVGVAVVLLVLTRVLMQREGRSLSNFGLSLSSAMAKHLVLGLIGGMALFSTGSLVLRLALPFVWERNQTMLPNAILGMLVFHLITNSCEELAWRGYAFEGFLRVFGHWPAQMIVALVSAYFHVLSGWSWPVALTTTTVGSVLFALVFLRWSSIPAAVGVHAGWNWTRDLILTPASTASILTPIGTQKWTSLEWSIAQAVFIGVSLLACVGLLRSPRRPMWVPSLSDAAIADPADPA
jgi:membrane protease YdiL (CAAX protease family)